MEDSLKTKEQLISELKELRRRMELYDQPDEGLQPIPAELVDGSENYHRILDASPN
jgi:hypothetical protein